MSRPLIAIVIIALAFGTLWVFDNNKRADNLLIEDPTARDYILSVAGSGGGGTIDINVSNISHDQLKDRNLPENHLQYLLIDGTRIMTGNLNVANRVNLTTGGNINAIGDMKITNINNKNLNSSGNITLNSGGNQFKVYREGTTWIMEFS